MNPDTLTLFRAVATRSPAEREEYYDRNQVSSVLRLEVESLLQAGDGTVDSFAGHLASAAVRALLEDPLAPAETPQATPARSRLQPEAIGRYQVLRLLGRGGMSDVYLARDPMLARDIAVKLIAGELDNDAARRRLVREASAAGRLRHPNIVTIFDAGEHDGRPFIAMEHVPGETLRALIQRRVALPLRRRLQLIEDACAGLAHAHRAGVVHLDIKPDNLIVDASGVLKVLDFGIARVLSSEAFATRHILGTLRYMSPEQIAGDPLDHRSDIFSLGCSLYELLTYLPAYSGSTREIVYRIAAGPVPRLAEVMPDVDPRLDAAVGRAMALDVEERYADLDQFQAELAHLRAELDPAGDRVMTMPDPRLADQSQTIAIPTPASRSGSAGPRRTGAPSGSGVPPVTPSASGALPLAAARRRQVAAGVLAAGLLAVALGLWRWQPGAPSESPAAVSAPVSTPDAAASGAAPPPPTSSGPGAAAPPEIGARGAGNEIWLRLAERDRQAVVRLLTPIASDPAGADRQLPFEVLAVVESTVSQSRAAATAAGAATTSAYLSAEAQRRAASRLAAGGNPVGAIDALLQAVDLYDQAVVASRASVPAPVGAGDPAAGTPPAPTPPSAQVALDPPSPIAVPPPQSGAAAASSPPPAPQSGAAAAAASPSLASPQPQPQPAGRIPSAPERSAEAVRAPTDRDRVLEVMDRYRAAYQNKSVGQLTQVYPSLLAIEAKLRASMDGIATYDLQFVGEPRVQIQGDTATVSVTLLHRITPTVGNRTESHETAMEFRLRRTGGNWLITAVTPR